VFIAEGVLLVLAALLIKKSILVPLTSARGWVASFLLLLGLVIYPLSGLLEGRTLTQLEWFPLLPAPITLVTVALLMLLSTRWRHVLVIVPLLWVVISGAFATTLGLLEFYFMVGSGVLWLLSLVRLTLINKS
jgi:hypothetical protein